jgi:hypothetical protein
MADNATFRMMELKQEGYCCAQIILILALDARGETNPDLVRASGGLCFGVSASGGTCGALCGGACLISLYAGKGGAGEKADERLPLMLNALSEWFGEAVGSNYGGTLCNDILTQAPDKSACGPIAAATYGKAMEILAAHGMEPGKAKG